MDEANNFENMSGGLGSQASEDKSALTTIQDRVADKLHAVAATIEEKADQNEGNLAGYAGRAAEWLDDAAGYVQQMDPQKVKSDIQKQVRRNPGRSLLIAGVAGLLLGVLLRR